MYSDLYSDHKDSPVVRGGVTNGPKGRLSNWERENARGREKHSRLEVRRENKENRKIDMKDGSKPGEPEGDTEEK